MSSGENITRGSKGFESVLFKSFSLPFPYWPRSVGVRRGKDRGKFVWGDEQRRGISGGAGAALCAVTLSPPRPFPRPRSSPLDPGVVPSFGSPGTYTCCADSTPAFAVGPQWRLQTWDTSASRRYAREREREREEREEKAGPGFPRWRAERAKGERKIDRGVAVCTRTTGRCALRPPPFVAGRSWALLGRMCEQGSSATVALPSHHLPHPTFVCSSLFQLTRDASPMLYRSVHMDTRHT
ncbi:hypothetical protein H6P81_020371 [Aristolochia fimbriata]|uniref:Uncharacterized protein n=1 Tax=Aristolochia fimbriata TaxID=158543 RepID=A0AAV7DX97_ARIFI|nr:hypothetical protein H6P81_020371 [Aristolochia fimbriata]